MQLSHTLQTVVGALLQPLKYDAVSSLAKQEQSPVVRVQLLHHDAHPLPRARKIQNVQQLVLLRRRTHLAGC